MATVFTYDDERMEAHKNGPNGDAHPECPARLEAVREALAQTRVTRQSPRVATDGELLRVHPQFHLDNVRAAAAAESALDPDTACSTASDVAARLGCGSVVQAVESVISGACDRAFCAVRPPGHHAVRDHAMGFCLYSTVAVGVEAALATTSVDRVAVLDFDVHHGNGTQDIFYERNDVLVVNWHQYPFYPGSGAAKEIGAGDGIDATVNIPLAVGEGDEALLSSWDNRVQGLVEHFAPDIILVSAGFDGDKRDPLGGLNYTAAGFAGITERIVQLADRVCGGRVVSSLEGGYAIDALTENVRAHVDTLG